MPWRFCGAFIESERHRQLNSMRQKGFQRKPPRRKREQQIKRVNRCEHERKAPIC